MYSILPALRSALRPLSLSELARDSVVIEKAKVLVSYYYYILPYVALLFAANPISSRQNFEPHWPLLWADIFTLEYSSIALFTKLLFVVVSIIAVFGYRRLFVRVAVFLVIFQVHALESSFGSINHQWYLWLYSSFLFIFLPSIWSVATEAFEKKRLFLLTIWGAQALAALTYTMAGMWKIFFAVVQAGQGSVHGFSPDAFAYQVANWVPRLQAEALLAPFIIEYPHVVWPFYVSLIFLQLFTLWIMIRPSLQRLWVALLVLFHIGTLLAMGISFHPLVILMIVLFFGSPFIPEKNTFQRILADLPVLGGLYLYVRRKATFLSSR